VKSVVETLNPTRVRLTVEVPFDELKPSVDAAYKKIASQVNVPGFRKGKVPPRIIDQRFGRAVVLDEAVNEALPRFYGQAVESEKIMVLGQPEVDVKEFADGSQLTFTAEVDVRPEFELPDYSAVEVTVEVAEVSEAEVDEQLDVLRGRFGTLTGVDRPAQTDDHVSIDLSGRAKDGSEIEDAHAAGLSYVVGSGSLVPGLDVALVGLSTGETKEFDSELVAGPRKGEAVDIEVKLNSVKQRELPELDDEFAQTASQFDTVAELREDMLTRMRTQKKLMQGGAARDKVLQTLLGQVEIALPESFRNAEISYRIDAINAQLAQAGLSMDDYLAHEGKSREEFDAEITQQAEEGIRAQFLLDAIARKENVSVQQQELTRHLIQRAAGTGLTPDQFAQQVVEAGQANLLVAEVVRSKALAVVLKNAKVTDTAGVEVDLAALRPEGAEELEDLVRAQMEALHDAGAEVPETIASAGEPDAAADPASAAVPPPPVGGAASIAIPAAPKQG